MTSTGSSSSAPAEGPAAARAELVIGLATYNSGDLVEAAADTLRRTLDRSPGAVASRVVVADGGSTDGTLDRVRVLVGPARLVALRYPVQADDLLVQPYHGVPARLRAVERILRQAQELGARACLVIDLAACGSDADWIDRIVQPVLTGGADFVSGVQERHAYAGALIKGVVSPVFRAVYGVRLRHPVADTFAVSERLMQHYLTEAEWPPDGTRPAIDVRLPAMAAGEAFRLAEASLGPRVQEGRDASPDLSTALTQAVGALFAELERRPDTWQRVRRSAPVPAFGPPAAQNLPVPPIKAEPLVDAFRLASRELRDLWAMLLPPRTSLELKRLADAPPGRFQLDDQLWARIVYDYAIAHRVRTLARDHLLPSLVPLYLGWLASFVLQTAGAGSAEAEARLEVLGEVFEQEKPYLIARWRWPERVGTAS